MKSFVRRERVISKGITKKVKIIITALIIGTSIIAFRIMICNKKDAVSAKDNNAETSIIKVKQGSKLYENKDGKITEIDIDTGKSNVPEIIKKNKDIELDTKDVSAPNKVENIDIKLLENNAIINFTRPEDKGTDYEYIIKNDNDEEKINFHSESGIYGYSYKISNNKNDEANTIVNKLEDTPILIQDINWNDDYYLHIRAIDNNMNYSESETFKIDLPSNGINVEYIDANSGNILSTQEKISGMINDDYNVENLKKDLPDYTLVDIAGDTKGKLKKEAINIKYKYSKNAKVIIRYIDRATDNEIAEAKEINGYEGKEVRITPESIEGYVPEEEGFTTKMTGNKTITIIYNKIEEPERIIDSEETEENKGESKEPEENKEPKESKKSEENKETEEGKESEKNEGTKQPENEKKTEKNEEVKIEENKEDIIKIKYVDINTNKILYEDKVTKNNKRSIKYKLKEIEGYKLVSNIEEPNDKKQINDNSIIDEIIKSLGDEVEVKDNYNSSNLLTENEKRNSLAQYEIVMNCDDSEYIIYYKR